jgi:hypothetical protein
MWGSRKSLGLLPLIVLTAACAGNPAPKGWLAPPPDASSEPYGAWVELELPSAGRQLPAGGELIAIASDSLFVLTPHGEFFAIARADATRARVAYYDSQYGDLAVWTTFGSLATASHGLLLIISFPIWTVTGWPITAGQSRAPLVDVGPGRRAWDEVAKYARYPQGLPVDLDRARLQPKPQG